MGQMGSSGCRLRVGCSIGLVGPEKDRTGIGPGRQPGRRRHRRRGRGCGSWEGLQGGVNADAMNAVIGLTRDVMVPIGAEEVEAIGMGAKTGGFKRVHAGETTIANDLLSGFGIGELQIGTTLFVMAWHVGGSPDCLCSIHPFEVEVKRYFDVPSGPWGNVLLLAKG